VKTVSKEVLERRELLITESAIERERLPVVRNGSGTFSSGNCFGRAVTSSAGRWPVFSSFAGGRKLVEMIGKRFGGTRIRTATGLWRAGLTRK
jgi:hypothetical protein